MDNQELLSQIGDLLEQHTTRIETKIENEVTKRIDALFDGYKLVHDHQWALERKTEALQEQIEALQLRIMALENKTA